MSAPRLGYAFNGEIVLDEANTPEAHHGLRQIKALSGTYCLRQAVIKVVPRDLARETILQSNLILRCAHALCRTYRIHPLPAFLQRCN